ncbi:hypothetical protein CRI70_03815 [Streptomyces sp. Ru87]|nr:hypothetical protein CRI70_03815 [Streptomyces sp. Ru87]
MRTGPCGGGYRGSPDERGDVVEPDSVMVLMSVVTAAAAHVGSEAARRALADLSALARRIRGAGPAREETGDGADGPGSEDGTDGPGNDDRTGRPGSDGHTGSQGSAEGADGPETADGADGPEAGDGSDDRTGTAEDAAASGPEALRDYAEELLRRADHDPALARELEDWARRHAPALGVTGEEGAVHNTVSGDARITGPVVQARDISGGISFGGPDR